MSETVEIEKVEPATEAPGTALALFDDKRAITAQGIYVQAGGVDAILADIKAIVAKTPTDISTPKGREAVKSLAHKVARTKTAILGMGLALTEEARKLVKTVNDDKKRIETELDALKADVLADVTAWEAAEDARVKGHEDALATLLAFRSPRVAELSPEDIEQQIACAEAFAAGRDWQIDFRKRASDVRAMVIDTLNIYLVSARHRVAEEELARQREAEAIEAARQKAVQEQAEREAAIAAAAADKARIEAQQAAEAEAARIALETYEREKAADLAREQERIRIQNEALAAAVEAENRKQKELAAERERTERAEQDRMAALAMQALAEKKAEEARCFAHGEAIKSLVRLGDIEGDAPVTALEFRLDRVSEQYEGRDWEEFADTARHASKATTDRLSKQLVFAKARDEKIAHDAEVERLRSLEAERQKARKELDDKIAATNAEADARSKNVAHRRTINREVVAALTPIIRGSANNDLDENSGADGLAKAIVEALAKGQVPHCKIEY